MTLTKAKSVDQKSHKKPPPKNLSFERCSQSKSEPDTDQQFADHSQSQKEIKTAAEPFGNIASNVSKHYSLEKRFSIWHGIGGIF